MLGFAPLASSPIADDGLAFTDVRATVSSSASVSAGAIRIAAASAAISALSAVSVADTRIRNIGGSVSVSLTLVADGESGQFAKATINPSLSASASCTISAPVAATSLVQAQGVVDAAATLVNSAATSAATGLVASADKLKDVSSQIAAAELLSASAARARNVGSVVNSALSVSSLANVTAFGSSTIALQSAVVAEQPNLLRNAAASIIASATFSAAARLKWENIPDDATLWTDAPDDATIWTDVPDDATIWTEAA